MRFSLRIFLGFFLIVSALGWYAISLLQEEIKPAVRQSTEEVLIDTANLLAELISDDFAAGKLDQGRFVRALEAYQQRRPEAMIWGIRKHSVDFRVYVTDAQGVVLLDSTGQDVGKDYSRWRDVHLTLRGSYGVRTSRTDPADPMSSTMYVAAPILAPEQPQRIIGVLTVVKPNHTLQPYIERTRRKLEHAAWGLLAACVVLGAAFSWVLSRAITRLTRFAQAVSAGKPVPMPRFVANRELAQLARALDAMRSQLDGKAYIEQTALALTHELKSPLTGIRGSAELLAEPLAPEDVQRFSGHILAEAGRMQTIVDRMLELARLEIRHDIAAQSVPLQELVAPVVDALSFQLQDRTLRAHLPPGLIVHGEAFLLSQAIRNLLQNALDFTPPGGEINLEATYQAGSLELRIHNSGATIPEFALPRLFERFYSLPGPYRKNKGSGLGLALTRAIATLHGGTVTLRNATEGGVEAILALPSSRVSGAT